MTRKRIRVSPAEEAARRIVALGPQVKESAWQAAQAFLAQRRADRRGDVQAHLAVVERREGRA